MTPIIPAVGEELAGQLVCLLVHAVHAEPNLGKPWPHSILSYHNLVIIQLILIKILKLGIYVSENC